MAAASLRCAASRIGGRALQRARSAAEQRRLVHTRRLTDDEKTDAAARLFHIELKKEQLYHLIAKCQTKYPVGGKLGLNNTQLLEHLSKQIEPRRHDPLWRSCRRWAFAHDCYKFAGAIFIGTTAANVITYSIEKMYPREGNNKKMVGLKNVLPS